MEIDYRALATPEDRRDYLMSHYKPRLRKSFKEWSEEEINDYNSGK